MILTSVQKRWWQFANYNKEKSSNFNKLPNYIAQPQVNINIKYIYAFTLNPEKYTYLLHLRLKMHLLMANSSIFSTIAVTKQCLAHTYLSTYTTYLVLMFAYFHVYYDGFCIGSSITCLHSKYSCIGTQLRKGSQNFNEMHSYQRERQGQ